MRRRGLVTLAPCRPVRALHPPPARVSLREVVRRVRNALPSTRLPGGSSRLSLSTRGSGLSNHLDLDGGGAAETQLQLPPASRLLPDRLRSARGRGGCGRVGAWAPRRPAPSGESARSIRGSRLRRASDRRLRHRHVGLLRLRLGARGADPPVLELGARARAAGRRGGEIGARTPRRVTVADLAVLLGFGLAVCSLAQVPGPVEQLRRIAHRDPDQTLRLPEARAFVASRTRPASGSRSSPRSDTGWHTTPGP